MALDDYTWVLVFWCDSPSCVNYRWNLKLAANVTWKEMGSVKYLKSKLEEKLNRSIPPQTKKIKKENRNPTTK